MIKFALNKTKRIGNVAIIVEGEQEEPQIFHKIFHEILGYTCNIKTKNQKSFTLFKGHDPLSSVHIINANSNNIKFLNTQDYYAYIFKLEDDYGVKLKNASTYFIFDRDPKNNKLHMINRLARELSSAQNDSETQNGLLLLSYPCIESFLLNGTMPQSYLNMFGIGKDLKKHTKKQKLTINQIDEHFITHAAGELQDFLSQICNLNISDIAYDNFSEQHLSIIEAQQEHYKKHNTFYCVSEILLALIDLGVLTVQQE